MMALKHKLIIEQGRTLRLPIRWETEEFAYAPISAISKAAPCQVTTTLPHGIPDGWRAAVVSAGGMVEVNATASPPEWHEFRRVTVVSSTVAEFNALNAADFTAYTSGGYLQYRVPHDLAGYKARMSIKDKVGGTELLSLTTENGRILVNDANKVVELFISATDSASFAWRSGIYDLELISPSLEVSSVIFGPVAVTPEVTT